MPIVYGDDRLASGLPANDPRLGGLPANYAHRISYRRMPFVQPDPNAQHAHPRRQAAARRGLVPVHQVQPYVRAAPARPGKMIIPVQPMRLPPGSAPINPNVVGWYYQEAFSLKTKQDNMSKNYPWLFGPEGLYGGMCVEDCEYPCELIDGVCVCPED